MGDETNNALEQGEHADASGVDLRRRSFARIGAASPVIMSLASRPALAGPCLSNMMSGDLYHDRGSCDAGWSPGGWKNPGGAEPDWHSTPFDYGVYDEDNTYGEHDRDCNSNKQNESDCYDGGSTLDYALSYHGISVPALSSLGHLPLREILHDNTGCSTGNCAGHFVAALLNASHVGIDYVLSAHQLADMWNGVIPVPGGLPINEFLDSTWGGTW